MRHTFRNKVLSNRSLVGGGRVLSVGVYLLVASCALTVFVFGLLAPKASVTTKAAVRQYDPRHAPMVDQVVLVLIDALRPDFALRQLAPYTGGACGGAVATPLYTGPTLTYIEEALMAGSTAAPHDRRQRPTLGAFFVADVPTTTAQRLKAITTGVIPALVEAGKNFFSDAVEEDSLMHQLQGRSVVLGDDTWLSLYPQEGSDAWVPPWREHVVFPSFQVDDLDTNDDGILEHLPDVLRRHRPGDGPHNIPRLNDAMSTDGADDVTWGTKLILAHFLGVDHAGHTFAAHHRLMDDKLAQLNAMLRNVSQVLAHRAAEDDVAGRKTLLLVLGDHGMTDSGDHGGGSEMETDSFLFAEVFGGPSASPPGDGLDLDTHSNARSIDDWIAHRWARCQSLDGGDLCRLAACAEYGAPGAALSAFRQVDLVPTLSILLGASIPFASCGRLIPELLALAGMEGPPSATNSHASAKDALSTWAAENCRQLRTMSRSQGVALFANPTDAVDDDTCCDQAQSSYVAMEQCMSDAGAAVRSATLHIQWTWVVPSVLLAVLAALGMAWRPCVMVVSAISSSRYTERRLPIWVRTVLVGVVVLRNVIAFSNSFVVFEDSCVRALTTLLLLTVACCVVRCPLDNTSALLRWVGVALLCVRCLYPEGWRLRRHGTHALDAVQSASNDLLAALAVHTTPMCASTMRHAFVWVLFRWCSGLGRPHPQHLGIGGRGGIFELGLLVAWNVGTCTVGGHTTTVVCAVGCYMLRRFGTRGICCHHNRLRSESISCWIVTYWLSHLCDAPVWRLVLEVHAALVLGSTHIARSCVDHNREYVAPLLVAVLHGGLVYCLTLCASFGVGQQHVFPAVDWLASTASSSDVVVGSTVGSSLAWKGALVVARTFAPWIVSVLSLCSTSAPPTLTAMSSSAPGKARPMPALFRLHPIEVFGLLTVLYAVCAAVASLVLREHLMAVAIFCPNMIFVALTVCVTAATTLLAVAAWGDDAS